MDSVLIAVRLIAIKEMRKDTKLVFNNMNTKVSISNTHRCQQIVNSKSNQH